MRVKTNDSSQKIDSQHSSHSTRVANLRGGPLPDDGALGRRPPAAVAVAAAAAALPPPAALLLRMRIRRLRVRVTSGSGPVAESAPHAVPPLSRVVGFHPPLAAVGRRLSIDKSVMVRISWIIYTVLCIHSFAMFCYVFLGKLRGPAVGSYGSGPPA